MAYLFVAGVFSNDSEKSHNIKFEFEKIKNKYPQKPLLIIANKIDKLDDVQLEKLNSEIDGIQLLTVKSGFGVEQLTNSLLKGYTRS